MDHVQKAELDALFAETPYAIVGQLGRGAMANVYVVRQKFLRKKFALKRLRSHLAQKPDYVARLKREAQCLGTIENPHILGIVDFARTPDGIPYIVLDLLEGRSLEEELNDRGRLPVEEAIAWTHQALSGVGAAHEAGLTHRDLSPSNLFLRDIVDSPRLLKVMDFGLAGIVEPSVSQGTPAEIHTNTGTIVGSPAYASPEATRGERLDERADLFSIGVVLFQMLTGVHPILLPSTKIPRPSEECSSVPPELDAIVERATNPSREHRYQSAQEFRADLASIMEPS